MMAFYDVGHSDIKELWDYPYFSDSVSAQPLYIWLFEKKKKRRKEMEILRIFL